MPTLTELLGQWRADLAAWAIPEHVTSAVTESPWVLPRQVFARRADRLRREPAGPSWERAREALDPAGSVLDIGAGAGAACLPLAPRITALTAVDTDPQMLELLAERAAPLGVPARLVCGRWPDVAGQSVPADVVTCHHVTYNVPDIDYGPNDIEAALSATCAVRLPRHKQPSAYCLVEEMPLGPTGKISRRLLKDLVTAEP